MNHHQSTNMESERIEDTTKLGNTQFPQDSTKSNNSFLLIFFGITIIILTVISGFLFYQNQKVKKELAKYSQPTPAPTIAPSPTPELQVQTGYVGYNPDGKRFTLDLPEECVEDKNTESQAVITCTTDDFVITITPSASGFGLEGYEPEDIKTGELNVDGYTWEYKIWIDTDGTAFGAYSLTDPDTNDYYLIHVEFDPYSSDAQDYLEDILSTFEFIENNEFVCPEEKTLDCTPCQNDPCPAAEPAYCSKGSAYYNWITTNCPDVEIIGLE